jgi:hypothetical protein
MSDPSAREDREFAGETRGPKPKQGRFGHTSGWIASHRKTVGNLQKSKNVRDMRGLAHADAVNLNEAGS